MRATTEITKLPRHICERNFVNIREAFILGGKLNVEIRRKITSKTKFGTCGINTQPKTMFLMYYENENGERVYTLKKTDPNGRPTLSAHPARFSPDDKFARHRNTIKKRFGIHPTQQPKLVM